MEFNKIFMKIFDIYKSNIFYSKDRDNGRSFDEYDIKRKKLKPEKNKRLKDKKCLKNVLYDWKNMDEEDFEEVQENIINE